VTHTNTGSSLPTPNLRPTSSTSPSDVAIALSIESVDCFGELPLEDPASVTGRRRSAVGSRIFISVGKSNPVTDADARRGFSLAPPQQIQQKSQSIPFPRRFDPLAEYSSPFERRKIRAFKHFH
jgi:hypothetical protein